MATVPGWCSSGGLSRCHLSLDSFLICGVGRATHLPQVPPSAVCVFPYFPCICSTNIYLVPLVCLAPCLELVKVHTF